MKDVAVTVYLPIDDIVDALEPRVTQTLQLSKALRVPKRKVEISQALLNACEEMASSYTRYEASLTTRDEKSALQKVLVAATHVRRAFRDLKSQQ